MADRVSTQQVDEIKQALDQAFGSSEQDDAAVVLGALRTSNISAFSKADLDGIELALAKLGGQSLQSMPAWSSTPGRGFFFVFEGLDRSGKSTQSKLLKKALEEAGEKVQWRCFPDRSTAIGLLIDLYLRKLVDMPDKAIHELFSANRWESMAAISEELNKGTSIVCDRYAFSGVAYSVSKGLDWDWCQAPDRGLLTPDGIFYLHVSEKVGAARSNFGDERYENVDMQGRVRKEFQRVQLREGVDWLDVDGARPIDDVHVEILSAVNKIKQKVQDNAWWPIKKLWVGREVTNADEQENCKNQEGWPITN